MKRYTHILLADDHDLFREALAKLLMSFRFSVKIHEAKNGAEALALLTHLSIDLILLDVQMPVMNGIELIKKLNGIREAPPVIVLSQFDEQSLIDYMLQNGVKGFLQKSCSAFEFERAILSVLNNMNVSDPMLTQAMKNKNVNRSSLASLPVNSREYQILSLMKAGKSNKEMSTTLKLSQRTIESYRKTLMKRTGCRNVAEIIGLAFKNGVAD